MRSVLRFVKHLLLAIVLIVSGICMLEVGIRARRLHQVLNGEALPQDKSLVRPCPLAYQQLPINYVGAYWSEETASEVAVRTNSLGMRGDEITLPKPSGSLRIVCLGDEATLALDIAAENTFCSQLKGILQPNLEGPVEIINAGQPGHCPLLSLAWVRWRLIGLQPDLVILCCDVSDVDDDRRCRPLANFDEGGVLLSVAHPAATDHPADLLSTVEREFMLARLLSDYLGDYIGTSAVPFDVSGDAKSRSEKSPGTSLDHPPASVEQAWEPLRELQDFCRQISAEFVVVVVPSAASVRSAAAIESLGDATGDILGALVERTNRERIPMLDASAEFARDENWSRLFLGSSGALSTEGHGLFAEILVQALLDREPSQSRPQTLPVSGKARATELLPVPLRTLERSPREPADPSGALE